MGRAARWFRNLWSGSKENKQTKDSSSYGGGSEARAEKKRWSFRKSQDSGDVTLGQNAASAAAIEAAWFKCFYDESKMMRKSKKVIAASTAVADAAAAVVHLAGNGASAAVVASHESAAAVRIQTAFRGYLARKAHRALKALVKLQALVRGYLVRKEAAAALHSMQALIRAQATVRAQRSRNLISDYRIFLPEIRHRRSLERLEIDVRDRRLSTGIDGAVLSRSPSIVELDTWRAKLRPCCRSSTLISASAESDDVSILHSFTSPLPSQVPAGISIPSRLHFPENEWWTTGKKCRLPATAHSTPRYSSGSVTPGKFCSSSSSSPNYMTNTQSSTAKLRKRQPLSEVHLNCGTPKPCIHQPQEPFAWLPRRGSKE
ncbi:uncharacterized protein LOC141844426 [Curcuma longa]|uniref:uncharacterized protein LOC141844426 n=1 Tax=Curcuma longa TaxID=136217 RepID=UPI003D9F6E5E